MEMPLLSVALCTFNGEKYIEQQLLSILNQTYTNIEIVIVDDCSTDTTHSILKKFQDSRLKIYRNEQNLGFNTNFIKAIALCSGNYVAISDQDDYWEKDKLEKMISFMGNNLLIYHNSRYIDEQGQLNGKSILSAHRFVSGYCSRQLLFNNCVSGHTCLIRKDLLNFLPPIPEGMYYDWWMAYSAACTGRINYTREALVNYRIHAYSFTQNDKQNSRSLRLKTLNLFLHHPLTSVAEQKFLKKLTAAFTVLEHKRFSFSLLLILLLNYKKLFYTRKRSFFSNLKFIFKESTR